MCQFLFCGQESKQRIFLKVKKNLYFLPFSPVNFLNPYLSYVPLSFFPQIIVFLFCKSFFDFLKLLIVCPCREFSRLSWRSFMAIKARWYNHLNCLSCSSCSMLLTCSTCSNWSKDTWILADKRRTCPGRKSMMTKKKPNEQKKQIVVSDLSDNNSVDEDTTPQGYTARGRTHPGGVFLGVIGTQKSQSLPVTRHQSTRHWSAMHQSASHWSTSHWAASHQSASHLARIHHSTKHWSSDTRHEAPVPSHRSSSHRSLEIDYQASGTSHQTLGILSPGTSHLSMDTSQPIRNILSWRLIMKYFLRSFSPFRDSRRAVDSFWRKNVHNTG